MLNSARNGTSFAAILVALAAVVAPASAETAWQKNHPRRLQTNHRLTGTGCGKDEERCEDSLPTQAA